MSCECDTRSDRRALGAPLRSELTSKLLSELLKSRKEIGVRVKLGSSNPNFLVPNFLFPTRNQKYAHSSVHFWFRPATAGTFAPSPGLVELGGFEPPTPCLQSRCSPS